MKSTLAVLAVALALTGCSSTQSTIANEKTGYAISRKQAKEIVESSILANFSPDYVNRGPESSLTSSGYIRFALDTHTVNATAIPMRGVRADGQALEGYGFEVVSFGTMPISGGSKATSVYRLIKQQAQMVGPSLKVQ